MPPSPPTISGWAVGIKKNIIVFHLRPLGGIRIDVPLNMDIGKPFCFVVIILAMRFTFKLAVVCVMLRFIFRVPVFSANKVNRHSYIN